ncbi:MAG: sulfatase-like hydrolase/transferase [Verrucomicrobiales bacterium]
MTKRPSNTLRGRLLSLILGWIFLALQIVQASDKPHLILVMADDQGWGQMGFRNHPHLKGRMPNLDAMAKAGIRFDRFYAAAPVCTPTRASVLTGRTPQRTGAAGLHQRLCLQEKTLSQALKEAGYATAHFGKWHLNGVKGPGMPVLKDDPNHPGHYGFDFWLSMTNFFDRDPILSRQGKFEFTEGESSELMVREALKFIEQNKTRPTFSVVWFGSPHFPFKCSAKDREGFPEGKPGDHLGEIVAIDRSIGMLRQGLRDLGIEKETLVWYTSDNGGLSTDPDSTGHLRGFKGSLHEGGTRVPAIIEWPGKIKPLVTNFPASTMDIMPTLVDLLGLPRDAMLPVVDGESISALLEGKQPVRSHPIPFLSKGVALIDGDFKLVRIGRGKGAKWALYDLSKDPGEKKDLSKKDPERFQALISQAEKLMASAQASAEGKDYPEGRIIQPQRGTPWMEMEDYQKLYPTFQKLNPNWNPPKQDGN